MMSGGQGGMGPGMMKGMMGGGMMTCPMMGGAGMGMMRRCSTRSSTTRCAR